MTNPQTTLRHAAKILRHLAEDATPGPWESVIHYHRKTGEPVLSEVAGVIDIEGDGSGGVQRDGDARWIAAMSPAIAEPLALLLVFCADIGGSIREDALPIADAVIKAAGEGS